MVVTWEEGKWAIVGTATFDIYDEDLEQLDWDNYQEAEFALSFETSSSMVLSNLFRIWATRPDELKVFNPILWGELAKEFKAYLIKEYNLLAGEECVECIVEIYRDGVPFGEMSIPEEELQKIYFW